MAKKNVTVIFDRQGVVGKTGRGKVEIRVYLAANVRKYIVVGEATKTGWKSYQNSKELQLQVEKYEEVVRAMKLLGEEMTIENFNAHIEVEKKETKAHFSATSSSSCVKKSIVRSFVTALSATRNLS